MTPLARLDAVLAPLPRVELGVWPTPLVRLPRISKALGIDLWMKRDECSGLALGGNKARKLEFVLAGALAAGAKTLLTVGPVTSNHTMMTAAAGRRLGLDVHVVLGGDAPAVETGNLALTRVFGAHVHVTPLDMASPTQAQLDASFALTARLLEETSAYFIPAGATMPGSVPGYVAAVREVVGQCDGHFPFDAVVAAYGTGSTAAGLLAGLALGGFAATLHAVSVSSNDALRRFGAASPEDLAHAAAVHHGWPVDPVALSSRCSWVRDAAEPGYGLVTPESEAALRLFASEEGLLLDPTYTAKAAAGLMRLVANGQIRRGDRVLFVHTGGLSTTAAGLEH